MADITKPLTRSTATAAQLNEHAKSKFALLKKYESFDVAAKQEIIEKKKAEIATIEAELDAYFDFIGIPKEEPPKKSAASSSAPKAAKEFKFKDIDELKEEIKKKGKVSYRPIADAKFGEKLQALIGNKSGFTIEPNEGNTWINVTYSTK